MLRVHEIRKAYGGQKYKLQSCDSHVPLGEEYLLSTFLVCSRLWLVALKNPAEHNWRKSSFFCRKKAQKAQKDLLHAKNLNLFEAVASRGRDGALRPHGVPA